MPIFHKLDSCTCAECKDKRALAQRKQAERDMLDKKVSKLSLKKEHQVASVFVPSVYRILQEIESLDEASKLELFRNMFLAFAEAFQTNKKLSQCFFDEDGCRACNIFVCAFDPCDCAFCPYRDLKEAAKHLGKEHAEEMKKALASVLTLNYSRYKDDIRLDPELKDLMLDDVESDQTIESTITLNNEDKPVALLEIPMSGMSKEEFLKLMDHQYDVLVEETVEKLGTLSEDPEDDKD